MRPNLSGYVTDIPYVFGFKPMLAPAWLDFVALLGGVGPPDRSDGFAWCDLGCGQGVTAAVLAATHPDGAFHGIDAMAVHIDHATRLAAEFGAANARFHMADFAAAETLPLPAFDYIVAHGVYTWVDAATRADLRHFVERRLKPGGLFYVSYNALPGWTGDLPFQYLARALAATGTDDSAAGFAAAAGLIGRLADAGASSLAASFTMRDMRKQPFAYTPSYLVHEFLHAGWQPLYVTDVRRDMAEIGLQPVGSALLVENFDAWILSGRARAVLAEIADPDLRELARDFLIDQRFRCDVFARDPSPLDGEDQRDGLFAAGLALAKPPAAIAFAAATPAGHIAYDTPAAREIVSALASGARRLFDIATSTPGGDLLANALALCAAGDIRPVETTRVPVAAINHALRRRLGTAEEIPVVALPCGTALEVDHRLLGLDGSAIGAVWREFVALHGLD